MNIKYIGRHDQFKDNIYGTGLVWIKGETVHPLSEQLAARFLRHTDCFICVPGDDAPLEIAVKKDEYEAFQEAHDMINQMRDIGSIASYVHANYAGYKLNKDITLQGAKDIARMLYNQYGPDGGYTPKKKPEKVKPVLPIIHLGGYGEVKPSAILAELNISLEQRVVSLHKQGNNSSQIAKVLGIHTNKATAIIRHHG